MQPQSAYHLAFHPSSDVENPANDHGSTFSWGYTENSSFPYTGVEGNLRYCAGFSLACLARIALARASIFVASVVRWVLRSRAA